MNFVSIFFVYTILVYLFNFLYVSAAVQYPAPFGAENTIIEILCLSVNFMTEKLMPPIAVLFVLWAGFMYIIAGTSPENITKAKNILISTFIGVVILLLAPALVTFIVGAVGGVSNTAACSVNSAAGSITGALVNIINWTGWFIASVSVIMAIYAAFLFITSRGDPQAVKTATRVVFFTVIGILVSVLAFSIKYIIDNIIL